jgi:hypothetical protein
MSSAAHVPQTRYKKLAALQAAERTAGPLLHKPLIQSPNTVLTYWG